MTKSLLRAEPLPWAWLIIAFAIVISQAVPSLALAASVTASTGANELLVRGRFSDATAEDAALWKAKLEGARACFTQRTAEMKAKLMSAGRAPTALQPGAYGSVECSATIATDRVASSFSTWSAFSVSFDRARLLFTGLQDGVERRAGAVAFDDLLAMAPSDVARAPEQVLRQVRQSSKNPYPGVLSDDDLRVFNLLLELEIQRVDRENVEALKRYVAKEGWAAVIPRAQEAGGAVWLIIQHADQDPSLQLEALDRLAAGRSPQAVGRPYALLYDRVHSSLFGEQEYGTQLSCQDGKLTPKGLRNPEKVDARRREFGLQTLQEYQSDLERQLGKVCQAPPPKPTK